jgi:hypothetical protein
MMLFEFARGFSYDKVGCMYLSLCMNNESTPYLDVRGDLF